MEFADRPSLLRIIRKATGGGVAAAIISMHVKAFASGLLIPARQISWNQFRVSWEVMVELEARLLAAAYSEPVAKAATP